MRRGQKENGVEGEGEDRTRGRRGDEGEDRKERERGLYVYVCIRPRICTRVGARASAGTTESMERNTEKTLVKGKRPLCLPFQSNRPPLSPLSFSLCPRFGSLRVLSRLSRRWPPLSFSRGLSSSSASHPLSLPLFPSLSPDAFPLPGFLFVLPPSSDLRLTHPEERRRIFSLSLLPSLSFRLFALLSFLLVSSTRYISDEQKREAQKEPCQKEENHGREKGTKRFSFFALSACARCTVFLLPPSLALPTALSLHPLTSPDTIQLTQPTTLTFSPFFPCCVSICLRPVRCLRLFLLFLLFAFPSRPVPSFLHPLSHHGFAVPLYLRLCFFVDGLSPLSPSPSSAFPSTYRYIAVIPRSFAHRQPSRLSRSRLFLIPSTFRASCFNLQRETYDKWLDMGEQQGEKRREKENERRLHIGRFLHPRLT